MDNETTHGVSREMGRTNIWIFVIGGIAMLAAIPVIIISAVSQEDSSYKYLGFLVSFALAFGLAQSWRLAKREIARRQREKMGDKE